MRDYTDNINKNETYSILQIIVNIYIYLYIYTNLYQWLASTCFFNEHVQKCINELKFNFESLILQLYVPNLVR